MDKISGRGASVQALDDLVDPGYKAGAKVATDGAQSQGRIVGIDRKSSDGVDVETIAIEIADGRQTRLCGVGLGTARNAYRLRLGLAVPIRVDGKGRTVLDWQAMCSFWGVASDDPGQRPKRSAPKLGIRDRAIDMRVEKLLKKGNHEPARIVDLERQVTMGMPTQNWTIRLQTDSGAAGMASGQFVPFYAAWLAVPGAVVPAAFDAKGSGKAAVDWVKAATDQGDRPGRFEDAPPAGSVAAALSESATSSPATTATNEV